MIIELKCVEQGHTDKRWHLDIKGEAAVLATVSGEQVARFPQADALKRFKMPGLLDENRHFAIAFDEQTVRFSLDVGALNKIENFLYRPIAAPQVVASSTTTAENTLIVARHTKSAPNKQHTGVTTPVKVIFILIGLAMCVAQLYGVYKDYQLDVHHGAYFMGGIAGRLTGSLIGVLIAVMCVQSIMKNAQARDLADGL